MQGSDANDFTHDPQGSAMLPISIFVIAKNEAKRLPATLEAVKGLGEELVVVDSGSTDGTQAIAQSCGARVVETHWRGYGPQKRFAEEQCSRNWVLNIDADEVLTPALISEIRALFANGEPPLDGYTFPIVEVFPGETNPGAFAYALIPVRLYRLDRGRYANELVHDRVAMAPGTRIAQLKGQAMHYCIESLSSSVEKLNRYSDQQVHDMSVKGRRTPAWRIWTEFPMAFLKAYLLRRHILRGRFGFVASVNYAFYRFMRIAKALEAQDRKSA